jgi:hypothetical protein
MKMMNRLSLACVVMLVAATPLAAQAPGGEVESSLFPVPAFPPTNLRESIKLEDERYLVEVSRSHGTITRIRDKQSGLELIAEPRLADNFRFTLPLPGKEPLLTIEANYIWGKDQKLSSVEVGATNLTLHWDQPLKNYLGEKFAVAATMDIKLTPDGVLFHLHIDNATPYPIGEVFFPLLGGLQGIGTSSSQMKATQLIRPAKGDTVVSTDIFRVFVNDPHSWLGDQGPEQFYECPNADMPASWMDLTSPQLQRSVYIGAHAPTNRSVVLRLELVPGNSQTLREDGNWPRPSELNGLPAGVSVCYADFPNAPAGQSYEAPDVLVAFHDGDWHAAQNIHNQWKASK